MYQVWRSGDSGATVKACVDNNFKELWDNLSKNMMSLTTEQRLSLSEDYLSEGLLVYDKNKNKWYQYLNGAWVNSSWEYSLEIYVDDWIDNKITIPYSLHKTESPTVGFYVIINGQYVKAVGGVSIDEDNNIILSSKIAFDGKVVIK